MFDFVDLFAGVGGFHAALKSLGGNGVQAAEIDPNAARVYYDNWRLRPEDDVRVLAADPSNNVLDHAVLTGGFPCQPFSKSGRQLGMLEERGTLFHDIVRILEAKRPPVVMLENVRNLAGHERGQTWRGVVRGLRKVGYRVSDQPIVFSPHLLSPRDGGAPQIRERVYILGVYVEDDARRESDAPPVVANRPVDGWDPNFWSIVSHVLQSDQSTINASRYRVTQEEADWIDTWNVLLARLGPSVHLPGHPLWDSVWRSRRPALAGLPEWKQSFVVKNHDFYLANRAAIDEWHSQCPQIKKFPESRRKLEWQAQDAARDLWQLLLQMRPSGIRAKRPTYTPALVAMNQSSIYGPARRRLTPIEAARLQGFPEGFSFGAQVDSLGYKQMGNAVNVGAAAYVFKRFVESNEDLISQAGELGPGLVHSVLSSGLLAGGSADSETA